METKPLPPLISIHTAQTIAETSYGLAVANIKKLNSYIDLNFLIKTTDDQKFVLKISHTQELIEVLEAQHHVFNTLQQQSSNKQSYPVVCQTLDKQQIIFTKDDRNQACATRLLSYLEGTLLAEVQQTDALLFNFGVFLGNLNSVLQDLQHVGLQAADHEWNLKNALDIKKHLSAITNIETRRLIDYFLLQFEVQVLPKISSLRKGFIHGDANDYNVLVKGEQIAGLIDFGDACRSSIIFEPAIALAYLMMNKEDPTAVAHQFLKGYQQSFPLTEEEIVLLHPLICARLCTSLVMAAWSRQQDPDNTYISVHESAALKLLNKLHTINPLEFTDLLRLAGGIPTKSHQDYSNELATRNQLIPKALGVSYKEMPLKFHHGALQYLYGEDGQTYLDGVNNICHVGHCHPRVVRAGQLQMAHLNTNSRYLYDSLNAYAEQLLATFPEPLNRIIFVNSGSEATELALRIARTATKQDDILVLDGAYHGHSAQGIAISPYKYEGKGGFQQKNWVHKAVIPDTYRGHYKRKDAGKQYADDVLAQINKLQTEDKRLAAFICESLLSCGGQIVLPDGYLKPIYKAVRAQGGVCIADEVQVGFGRVGATFWGFQLQDVVPDLVTIGKPMGNGHPIAAVVMTDQLANSFSNGMEFFSSFGGNPVSCMIGKAVLDVIEQENLQQHAQKIGTLLLDHFNQLKKYPLVGDVRGIGLFLGIELVKDRTTIEPAAKEAAQIVMALRKAGILLSTDGIHKNVIKFKPPMVFSQENAMFLIQKLEEAIIELSK